MSDTHSSHAAPSTEAQFIPEELVEFKADDTEAGRNIGKMLIAFFFCLLFLVSSVNLLTSDWVSMRSAAQDAPIVEAHHSDAEEAAH